MVRRPEQQCHPGICPECTFPLSCSMSTASRGEVTITPYSHEEPEGLRGRIHSDVSAARPPPPPCPLGGCGGGERVPMGGREEVKERKREPLQLFFWQNSIQDFPLMIFKSLSFSTQNPAGKPQAMAFTTIASGVKDREPSLRCLSISPRPCKAMWLPRKPQGRCCARQGAGSKSWTPLETTLSNPSLCTQGTERASDLLRVTQQIGDWGRPGVWTKPCPAVGAHPAGIAALAVCMDRTGLITPVFFHYFFWHLSGISLV